MLTPCFPAALLWHPQASPLRSPYLLMSWDGVAQPVSQSICWYPCDLFRLLSRVPLHCHPDISQWAPALRKDFPQESNFFPVLWPLGSGSSSHHLYGARAGSLQQLFISVLHNLPWTSVSYIEFLIWNKFSSLKKKYTLSHVAQAGFELNIKPRMILNSCCLPPEAGITGLCHISDICGAGTIETGPLCVLWKLSTNKDTCQSPNSLPTVSTNLNCFNKMLQAVWLLWQKFQEQSICLLRPWWSYPPVG